MIIIIILPRISPFHQFTIHRKKDPLPYFLLSLSRTAIPTWQLTPGHPFTTSPLYDTTAPTNKWLTNSRAHRVRHPYNNIPNIPMATSTLVTFLHRITPSSVPGSLTGDPREGDYFNLTCTVTMAPMSPINSPVRVTHNTTITHEYSLGWGYEIMCPHFNIEIIPKGQCGNLQFWAILDNLHVEFNLPQVIL